MRRGSKETQKQEREGNEKRDRRYKTNEGTEPVEKKNKKYKYKGPLRPEHSLKTNRWLM